MALVAVLAWGVLIYNRLVGDKNRVLSAWSDIDVQLKRRHDLIPKLVDAVRHYAAYESATLAEVTELRTRSRQSDSIAEIGGVESQLAGRVRHLVALAEDYPDLKADENFRSLHHSLAEVEDHVQDSRRVDNGSVRDNNNSVEGFPSMVIARAFNFQLAEFFEIEFASMREAPEVDL